MRIDDFDVAVIIRGGGATADLSGFDTLDLAENVANFPLPVITGIGHERDESVLDMISNTRVKTPTAAAAFLIANLADTQYKIERAREAVARSVKRRMDGERMRLGRLSSAIPLLFSLVRTRQEVRINRLSDCAVQAVAQRLTEEKYRLKRYEQSLFPAVGRMLELEKKRMETLALRIKMQDPKLLLRRGYSITLCNGKVVRDASKLKPGDEITTKLEHGTVVSTVRK